MEKVIKKVKVALGIVGFLWVIYFINFILPLDLRTLGIHLRSLHGLVGILCAPFIHANFFHLAVNSLTLTVLLWIALTYDEFLAVQAILIIILVAGMGTWLFGSGNSVHIGASSVIYGLIGFLLLLGFYRREWTAALASITVFLLYGSLLFSLVIVLPGVSWSAHFFGFIGGVLAAKKLKKV